MCNATTHFGECLAFCGAQPVVACICDGYELIACGARPWCEEPLVIAAASVMLVALGAALYWCCAARRPNDYAAVQMEPPPV